MVPHFVFESLQYLCGTNNHHRDEIKQLFEGEDRSDRGIYIQSSTGHHLIMRDVPNESDHLKEQFNKYKGAGFMLFAKEVTGDQVRSVLDPVPFDIVASETFHLHQIRIDSVAPTGERYLEHSCSVGPIIVDVNVGIGPLKGRGPVLILEGKHRWLDAKERGDERILAWVGDQAIKLLGI